MFLLLCIRSIGIKNPFPPPHSNLDGGIHTLFQGVHDINPRHIELPESQRAERHYIASLYFYVLVHFAPLPEGKMQDPCNEWPAQSRCRALLVNDPFYPQLVN